MEGITKFLFLCVLFSKTTQISAKCDKETTTEDTLMEVGKFALKAGATAGAVLGIVTFAPAALGFGAGGVAAGSLAALYQSTFLGGTIASGGTFAALQSVGAAGLAAGTKAGLAAASVAANAIYSLATDD